MAPYNDKYCMSCANRTKAGCMTFCKVKQCKRIPTKRKHVNAVEFIPDAGVLIVRTRYYPDVKEVILAHRDEDGRMFKEEKTAVWIKEIVVEEPRKNKRAYARCSSCKCLYNHYGVAVKHFDFCPKCGAKFLESSGGGSNV